MHALQLLHTDALIRSLSDRFEVALQLSSSLDFVFVVPRQHVADTDMVAPQLAKHGRQVMTVCANLPGEERH